MADFERQKDGVLVGGLFLKWEHLDVVPKNELKKAQRERDEAQKELKKLQKKRH